MTMYSIMSEPYPIGDGNTLSSINTSCCRIHSQSYFPGKGKALDLRTRSWNKAGIVLMEPIISLWENLTTNSELSENCWPDFLKKIHYPLPLWGFTGIMKQLIKWNQNVVKESLRIPTSIRQTKMVILQALRRTLIWDYRELNLGSGQGGNWTRLGETGLQVQRSKSAATLPPTIFYIVHS